MTCEDPIEPVRHTAEIQGTLKCLKLVIIMTTTAPHHVLGENDNLLRCPAWDQ